VNSLFLLIGAKGTKSKRGVVVRFELVALHRGEKISLIRSKENAGTVISNGVRDLSLLEALLSAAIP
jgi:hypothetical protein